MHILALAIIIGLLPQLAVVDGYVRFGLAADVSNEIHQTSRSNPMAMLPVVLALATPAIVVALGTLRPVLLALGLVYLMLFGLTQIPIVGDLMQTAFRVMGSALSDSVPPNVGRDLLRVVGLDSEACRTRAVCEITEDAVRKYPTASAMLWSLTGAFQAHGSAESILKGLLGGLSGLGCESLYSTCSKSPLEKLLKSRS
ncbi:uncharacterized protein LOC119381824 [Rhipicephalus sanguineus]|uniref:Uncharacterized protein n=1 Tax=Rhipicephalus sanguineus TaxID=34632 RepID=A0A9D4Q5K6_RHISA|nr:uncharacterized protein LOC119381824 [Rhipicephalus sanguineus]KAH7968496.1 hypothetical protein HPB52_009015 [Rhipicephalus sanguineus]